MAESITKIVHNVEQVNPCLNWMDGMLCKGLESGPVSVTLGRPEAARTGPQNSKSHAMYEDIRKMAVIPMPGRRIVMADYQSDEVKALLVMWFSNERELEGRPLSKPPRTVLCPITGQNITVRPSTAEDFGKRDTAEFVEWLYATGTQSGVRWSEPAMKEYESYREARK